MIYYFAYGSNMNQEQMKKRCEDSKLIGNAVLLEYELAFTIYSPKRKCGCADIVKHENKKVFGLLYEISEQDLKALDIYEVHPKYYKRFTVTVKDQEGREYQAETYEVVNKEKEFQKPSQEYLQLLISAAQENNFPEEYQKFLSSFETV